MVCASVALLSGWVYGADKLSFHFLVSTWFFFSIFLSQVALALVTFFALSLLSLLFLYFYFCFSFLPFGLGMFVLCSNLLSFPQEFLLSPRSGVLHRSCLLFFFFEVFLSAFEISFLFFRGEVWPGLSVFGPALGSVDSSLGSGKICASVFAWAVSCSASFFSLLVVQAEPWSFFIAKKSLVVRKLF